MKHYLVKCKFGHVGRDKYLPLSIPVIANSPKEASNKAKSFRGVKKDHKDWCLEGPTEISYERYIDEIYLFENDIYFEKKTRSRLHLFEDRLVDEPNYSRVNGLKTNIKNHRKVRDAETIMFKLKKTTIITKSFEEEQFVHRYN